MPHRSNEQFAAPGNILTVSKDETVDFKEYTVSRRTALIAALAGASANAAAVPAAWAASSATALAPAVEALRVAMVDGDRPALNRLLHDHLNYMHSSGHSQTKSNVLSDLAGKQFFASLEFSDVAIDVVHNTGIATMTVDQVKNLPGGKTRGSRLRVMQTWLKSGADWQLLGRVSILVTPPPQTPAVLAPMP